MTGVGMGEPSTGGNIHIDFIEQDAPRADTAWQTFTLIKSEGFIRSGVERLNDSIRTYVWAILDAQAQTRASIIGTGTAFEAQNSIWLTLRTQSHHQ